MNKDTDGGDETTAAGIRGRSLALGAEVTRDQPRRGRHEEIRGRDSSPGPVDATARRVANRRVALRTAEAVRSDGNAYVMAAALERHGERVAKKRRLGAIEMTPVESPSERLAAIRRRVAARGSGTTMSGTLPAAGATTVSADSDTATTAAATFAAWHGRGRPGAENCTD